MVVRKRLSWQGFIVFDEFIEKHRADRDKNVTKWIKDGRRKTKDHITDGVDNGVAGFLGMLKGENLGKSILKLADPDEK